MVEEVMGTDNGIPTNLDTLMKWDGNLEKEVIIPIEREDFTLQVRVNAMSEEQQEKYEKQSTSVRGRGNSRIREVDETKVLKLYILNHVIDPDLNNSDLQAKFNPNNSMHPEDIVAKLFLPGELQKIGRLVLRLSGFDNSDEVDEQIANLMKS